MFNHSLTSEMETELNDILSAALETAKIVGFGRLNHNNTSHVASCRESLVVHYFKTVEDLQQAVMYAAIENECLQILAQGVALQNEVALKAPEKLINNSLCWLSRQAALEFK